MTTDLYLTPSSASADVQHRAQPRIRLVLADDHALVRRSLRQILDAEDDLAVVAEAIDLSSTARQVHNHAPDVLVLDLRMPDGSSIESTRVLRQQVPSTEIIVLTMEPSAAFAQRSLAAGAIGFVLKDQSDTELPEAVRRAVRGEEYVSPLVGAGLETLRKRIDGSRGAR
jgi:DNA-binding NarL/FixJ family response regulator